MSGVAGPGPVLSPERVRPFRPRCGRRHTPPDSTAEGSVLETKRRQPQVLEYAELVIWRNGTARCELWVVGGTPRLRLFCHGVLTRDFAVRDFQHSVDLAEAWKRTAAHHHRPH